MNDAIVGAVYHPYRLPQSPTTMVKIPTDQGIREMPLIDFLTQRLTEVQAQLTACGDSDLVMRAILQEQVTYYTRRIRYFATC